MPKRSDNANESPYETESPVSFAATSCGRGRTSSLETSISGAEDANLKLPLIPIAIINLWLLCRLSPTGHGFSESAAQTTGWRRMDFRIETDIIVFRRNNRLNLPNPHRNGQRAPITHKVAGYIEGFRLFCVPVNSPLTLQPVKHPSEYQI